MTSTSIRIRMYRVGFGDCFLIRFPGRGGNFHVLVDCGVHPGGDIGTMEQVVANVAAETGRQLAVLVATHAHKDHISGFGRHAGEFRKFSIGEVWMPWTEDKSDPKARRLKQKQHAAVARLQMAFAGMPAAAREKAGSAVHALTNLAGNEVALEQLHAGFGVGAKVRYFQAGDTAGAVDGAAGLAARFLGPPTDQNFLARMDPPASQHYLAAGEGKAGTMPAPFGPRWTADEEDLPVRLAARDKKAIEAYADEPPGALAFALDQAINNTSLVILFTFGGRHLLFPGDAQYGNWQYWLQKSDSAQVLGEVDFLKVAHHGSMNATPKDAIDHMGSGHLAAMVSTQNTPWPSIPREPLMKAIQDRTKNRMLRSDSLSVKQAAKGPAAGKLPSGFSQGDLWFDYQVEV